MVRPLRIERPGRGQSSRAVQRRETGRLSEPLRDWGRDLALYLGRKRCQLKLGKLAELAGGMDYASVAAAVTRFHTRLRRDRVLASAVVKLQAALMEAHE